MMAGRPRRGERGWGWSGEEWDYKPVPRPVVYIVSCTLFSEPLFFLDCCSRPPSPPPVVPVTRCVRRLMYSIVFCVVVVQCVCVCVCVCVYLPVLLLSCPSREHIVSLKPPGHTCFVCVCFLYAEVCVGVPNVMYINIIYRKEYYFSSSFFYPHNMYIVHSMISQCVCVCVYVYMSCVVHHVPC